MNGKDRSNIDLKRDCSWVGIWGKIEWAVTKDCGLDPWVSRSFGMRKNYRYIYKTS